MRAKGVEGLGRADGTRASVEVLVSLSLSLSLCISDDEIWLTLLSVDVYTKVAIIHIKFFRRKSGNQRRQNKHLPDYQFPHQTPPVTTNTNPTYLGEMPGTTPEKRARQDTQASEVPIPKCDLIMCKTATMRSVLKFAKLSENAYAPTKGK